MGPLIVAAGRLAVGQIAKKVGTEVATGLITKGAGKLAQAGASRMGGPVAARATGVMARKLLGAASNKGAIGAAPEALAGKNNKIAMPTQKSSFMEKANAFAHHLADAMPTVERIMDIASRGPSIPAPR